MVVLYFFVAIALALSFYGLRGLHRFSYGCIEVVVGVLVLIFTFVSPPTTCVLPGLASPQ
jgi:hypothetical protein